MQASLQMDVRRSNIGAAVRMVLPLIATSLVFCLIGVVDMAVAGWHGAAAQAAVGVADQVIFVMVLIATGLAAATSCFVSQSLGANRSAAARRYALDGLWLAAAFGALSAFLLYVGAQPAMEMVGCTQPVRALGVPYLQMCALGNLPFMLVLVQASIFRANNGTADCLRIWSLIAVVSIGGVIPIYFLEQSPLHHSLMALAAAWDAGALLGALYGSFLLRSFLSGCDAWRAATVAFLPPARKRLLSFAQVGIPVLVSEGCYIVSLFALYAILGKHPQSETLQAAYSVVLKIEETFGILPLVAMSSVSAAMVGRHVGAGFSEQARALGWQLACATAGLMLVGGGLIQLGGESLARLFSNSEALVDCVCVGTNGAMIALPVIAFAFILFACLEGAGRTALPCAAQFVGYIALRIPMAYVFSVTFGMGFFGIWLAIFVSRLAMAIFAAVMFLNARLTKML